MVWGDTVPEILLVKWQSTDLGAALVSSEIETVNQVREWFAEHLEASEPSDPFSWSKMMSTKEWERHWKLLAL